MNRKLSSFYCFAACLALLVAFPMCSGDSSQGPDGGGDGTDNTGSGTDVTGGTSTDSSNGYWGTTADGLMCDYKSDPHPCACADGEDNDGDGVADSNDLHCFGPYDDDEETYATGMPGDNEGSKAPTECPFDGNSGPGNDDLCCNPADPTTNVVPNGCDHLACCEVDLNGNGTGEHVGIYGECDFVPDCGGSGTLGCACSRDDDCDNEQYCVPDGNDGAGFCAACTPCTPDDVCGNPCDCGEACFGGFERPEEECGSGDADTDVDSDPDIPGCADGLTACPGGDADCDQTLERCVNGCCYPRCQDGVTPCDTTADCPDSYMCVTGCCIVSIVV